MEWIDLKDKLPELGKWVLGLTNYEQGNYEKMGGGIFQIRRIAESPEMGYTRTHWLVPYYVKEDAIFTHWVEIPNFPRERIDRKLYLNKFFKFPKKNNILWGQDFSYFTGNAPADVKFELHEFINNERVTLRAYGYGIIGHDSKSYGNGAICVDIQDIIKYMVKE